MSISCRKICTLVYRWDNSLTISTVFIHGILLFRCIHCKWRLVMMSQEIGVFMLLHWFLSIIIIRVPIWDDMLILFFLCWSVQLLCQESRLVERFNLRAYVISLMLRNCRIIQGQQLYINAKTPGFLSRLELCSNWVSMYLFYCLKQACGWAHFFWK